MEHSFLAVWREYQKCLKQRNALLRADRLDTQQIEIWDSQLVVCAERIDLFRSDYLARLLPLFRETLGRLNKEIEVVQLLYQRGWGQDDLLSDLLRKGVIIDRNQGFTRVGPHRADIRIKYGSDLASDILSRGQQKLLVYAMRIAQGKMLAIETGRMCTYLLDDLPSELDDKHQQVLCELFEEIGCQVLITCVDQDSLSSRWSDRGAFSMFHVEHGRIEQEALQLG